MSDVKELEQRLKNIIHTKCNTVGCKNCDLSWENGCSATELQNKIQEVEEDKTNE